MFFVHQYTNPFGSGNTAVIGVNLPTIDEAIKLCQVAELERPGACYVTRNGRMVADAQGEYESEGCPASAENGGSALTGRE